MFVLKDFVRRVSPSVFNSYCEGKGLDFRAQESDNADALAEAFAAFISATPQGSLQQLVQTELDFQDVDQLVGGKGSHLLIQKAKSLKLQIDENALGDMSSADKAMASTPYFRHIVPMGLCSKM